MNALVFYWGIDDYWRYSETARVGNGEDCGFQGSNTLTAPESFPPVSACQQPSRVLRTDAARSAKAFAPIKAVPAMFERQKTSDIDLKWCPTGVGVWEIAVSAGFMRPFLCIQEGDPKAVCYPLLLTEWAVSQRSAGSYFGMMGGPTVTRNYSSSLPKSD